MREIRTLGLLRRGLETSSLEYGASPRPYPQTVRIPAGETGRLQRSGTHEFPLDFETLESRNIRDLGRGSKAPLFPLPAASQGQ
ncbi:MAG: hypothetical protein AUH01_04150 [Acidobacteria bacterium 13_2_20CM_56_17]|nr:MAG: hypothetical protein AUH01_04150 [Acidobacteria bacterium 13_2_20CM_56_17]